jgi:hypothetical protein
MRRPAGRLHEPEAVMPRDDEFETIQDYVSAKAAALRAAADSDIAMLPACQEEEITFYDRQVLLTTRNEVKPDGRRGVVIDASTHGIAGVLGVAGFVITPDGSRVELRDWEWGY